MNLENPVRHDFTVIIPAFNEAPVIPDLIRELRGTFEKYALQGEIFLVDDGSTDAVSYTHLRAHETLR